jgi:hypothetical protein
MEIEMIMLSEKSESQKGKYHVFFHKCQLWSKKHMQVKGRLLSYRRDKAGGGRGQEMVEGLIYSRCIICTYSNII